jgi:predicted secreted hydrolase
MNEWWNSASSEKQYPLRYSVVSPDYAIDISLAAFTENQTKKIIGREFWYGFGSVTGSINGQEQHGWAYLAPLGRKKPHSGRLSDIEKQNTH